MSNSSNNSPVHSHCEWDPLEEVIIGSVQGAMRIAFEPALNAYYPNKKIQEKFPILKKSMALSKRLCKLY